MARKWVVMLAIVAMLIGVGSAVSVGQVTEAEIQAAIEAGISWVVGQQYADGHWGDWEIIASTGFAVLKLADYGYEVAEEDPLVDGPFDPDYIYHTQFLAGLNYILDNTESYPGDPGICYQLGSHETYNTSVALMAIAGARNPDYVYPGANPFVAGLTLKEIAELLVHYFEVAQNPDGAWRYWFTQEPSDHSNTGFAVLALRYAEALGCALSDAMKIALSGWLDYVQNDPGPGDDAGMPDPDGGGGYTDPTNWVNVLKAGNLLFEFAFVGDAPDSARILAAVDYIQRHWNDPDWDPGWKGSAGLPSFLAAYCLMKGLEAVQIETLVVGGSDLDWFQDMADLIVPVQNADGSWPATDWDYSAPTGLWSTIWALLTLEKTTPPPPVVIDIKPGSFPNSINPAQKGTTPVAIFSSETFDAPAMVDLTTLTFGATGDELSLSYKGKGGAVPHCGFEDVDGDGLLDIVAHFVTALCGFDVGDELGYLKGTMIDGTEFVACDSVRIVPSYAKKDALDPMAIVQELSIQVAPNPIRDVHTAYFNVVGPMAMEVDELWVQIFDLSGSLVWEEQSAEAEIAWHTNSLSGEYLANGVYIYRVLVLVDGQWVVGRLDTFAVSR